MTVNKPENMNISTEKQNQVLRTFGKIKKYAGFVGKILLDPQNSQELVHRGYNFYYDLKENIIQKMDLYQSKNSSYTTHNKEAIVKFLESRSSIVNIYNSLLESLKSKEDGLYGTNMLVSCSDNDRHHPHAFVVKKTNSTFALYFLDPEYAIGKRDKFSASITNGMKLIVGPGGNMGDFRLFRFYTNEKNKKLNKLKGIFDELEDGDTLIDENYKPLLDITSQQNNEYDILDYHGTTQDKISQYVISKLDSTSYIVKQFGLLAQQGKLGKVEIGENIRFKSKIMC